MTQLPKSVAGYYKIQSEPHRKMLLAMRKLILEVIPDVEEIIKYSMPTFVFEGTEVAGLKVPFTSRLEFLC